MPIDQAPQKLMDVLNGIKAKVAQYEAAVAAAEAAKHDALIALQAHQVDLAIAQLAVDQMNS